MNSKCVISVVGIRPSLLQMYPVSFTVPRETRGQTRDKGLGWKKGEYAKTEVSFACCG